MHAEGSSLDWKGVSAVPGLVESGAVRLWDCGCGRRPEKGWPTGAARRAGAPAGDGAGQAGGRAAAQDGGGRRRAPAPQGAARRADSGPPLDPGSGLEAPAGRPCAGRAAPVLLLSVAAVTLRLPYRTLTLPLKRAPGRRRWWRCTARRARRRTRGTSARRPRRLRGPAARPAPSASPTRARRCCATSARAASGLSTSSAWLARRAARPSRHAPPARLGDAGAAGGCTSLSARPQRVGQPRCARSLSHHSLAHRLIAHCMLPY